MNLIYILQFCKVFLIIIFDSAWLFRNLIVITWRCLSTIRVHLLGFIAISSSIVVTKCSRDLRWFEIYDLFKSKKKEPEMKGIQMSCRCICLSGREKKRKNKEQSTKGKNKKTKDKTNNFYLTKLIRFKLNILLRQKH